MGFEESPELTVDQTLHGYANGHRLVASSRKLPREAERTLLALSDLSGPGGSDAFDGYLTGYPLPSLRSYALARTWLATEMPRPGCVWTHTLIIPAEGRAVAAYAVELLGRFRRPAAPDDHKAYEHTIAVEAGQRTTATGPVADTLVSRVLSALYDRPESFAAVPADRAAMMETLVLRLWGQQWPSLQSSFAFCTGSLSNRVIDGRPFDFQVMPRPEARRVAKNPAATVVGEESLNTPEKGWTRTATEDVVLSDGIPRFRDFLHALGVQLPGKRHYFRPLAEMYSLVSSTRGPELATAVLNLVAAAFPNPSAGEELKRLVFVDHFAPSVAYYLNYGPLDLICGSLSLKEPQPFATFASHLRQLSSHEWGVSAEAMARALCSSMEGQEGALRDAVLDGISDRILPAELPGLCSRCSSIVGHVVARAPTLLCQVDAWKGDNSATSLLVEVVEQRRDALVPFAQGLVVATLEGHVGGVGERLIATLGDESLFYALDWANNAPHQMSQVEEWCGPLSRYAALVITWLSQQSTVQSSVIGHLTTALDPRDPSVRAAGALPWTKHAAAANCLPEQDRQRYFAFLLALGLEGSTEETFAAVVAAFEPLYRAAREGRLHDYPWRLISGLLPVSDWWWDWDRCEKMRRAMVTRFLQGTWQPKRLLELTRDHRTFEELVGAFDESRESRRFIRSLVDSIRGRGVAADWQLQVLEDI